MEHKTSASTLKEEVAHLEKEAELLRARLVALKSALPLVVGLDDTYAGDEPMAEVGGSGPASGRVGKKRTREPTDV